MKNDLKFLLVVCAVVFAWVFIQITKKSDRQPSSVEASQKPALPSQIQSPRKPRTMVASHPSVSISTDASVQSMKKMLGVLRSAYTSSEHFEDVLTGLADQAPKIYRDSNPDTGEMLTIRTEKPLLGTRYVHMQYVGDVGAKTHLLQHAGFEFKPGADSFSQVSEAIKQTFPELGPPTSVKSGYVRWATKNNYVLWAKTLTREDIQDDPVNAYSESDIGTIRVVVEKAVHED